MYYVYMDKNADNKLYVGVTQNPEKRLYYHNTNQGAEFTKNKGNFVTVFIEEYNTLKEARQREIQIKKWRREKKELLIEKYSIGLSTKKKYIINH